VFGGWSVAEARGVLVGSSPISRKMGVGVIANSAGMNESDVDQMVSVPRIRQLKSAHSAKTPNPIPPMITHFIFVIFNASE
jgi:hypothetical protein